MASRLLRWRHATPSATTASIFAPPCLLMPARTRPSAAAGDDHLITPRFPDEPPTQSEGGVNESPHAATAPDDTTRRACAPRQTGDSAVGPGPGPAPPRARVATVPTAR